MKRRPILLLCALLCFSLPLLGADEEHGEEHGPETFLGLPTWIWMSSNLLVFLGLLAKYVGVPISGLLETRSKSIAEDLEQAEGQRREAKEMKASLEEQVTALERQLNDVIARAEEDGAEERREILARAERERERLLEQAQEEIDLRISQAKAELTEHTARLAAELARQKLASSIGPQDLDRLFDDNLGRLERKIQ